MKKREEKSLEIYCGRDEKRWATIRADQTLHNSPTITCRRPLAAITTAEWKLLKRPMQCNVCTHIRNLVPVCAFTVYRWNSRCSMPSHIQMFTMHGISMPIAYSSHTHSQTRTLCYLRVSIIYTHTENSRLNTLWRLHFIECEMLLKFESSCGCRGPSPPSRLVSILHFKIIQFEPQMKAFSCRCHSKQTCIHYIIDLFFSIYKLHCQFQLAAMSAVTAAMVEAHFIRYAVDARSRPSFHVSLFLSFALRCSSCRCRCRRRRRRR